MTSRRAAGRAAPAPAATSLSSPVAGRLLPVACLLFTSLALAACNPKEADPTRNQRHRRRRRTRLFRDHPAPAQPQPPSSSFGLLSSLLATRPDEPGPYDEPRHSRGFDDDKPHAAVLELDRPLVELRSFSLWAAAQASSCAPWASS